MFKRRLTAMERMKRIGGDFARLSDEDRHWVIDWLTKWQYEVERYGDDQSL